jgi:hypothetical protein
MNGLASINPIAGSGSTGLTLGAFTLTRPYTIVMVVYASSFPGGFDTFLSDAAAINVGLTLQSTGTVFFQSGTSGDTMTGSVSLGAPHIYVCQGNSSGSTSAIYVDSASTPLATRTQSSSVSATNLVLCNDVGANQLLGSIGMLLIYNRVVTGSDLRAIVSPLGSKFNISTS